MADSRATKNAPSMTNAQGEFNPHKPPSEPLEKSGHQVGQMVGNDAKPTFEAQTLPAGTAPKSKTFQPNPDTDDQSQIRNPDISSGDGAQRALDDMPGSTSGDVHQGIGKPASGQTSTEIRNEGEHHSKHVGAGLEGTGKSGGMGLSDDTNSEAKKLQESHSHGPKSDQVHNASIDGAESKEPEKMT